jgi:cell division protein FtsW
MSLCAIGVVLSLARAQMAPGMQPKKMLKFGPAAFANSVRRARAARAAANSSGRPAARKTAGSAAARTTGNTGNGNGNTAKKPTSTKPAPKNRTKA